MAKNGWHQNWWGWVNFFLGSKRLLRTYFLEPTCNMGTQKKFPFDIFWRTKSRTYVAGYTKWVQTSKSKPHFAHSLNLHHMLSPNSSLPSVKLFFMPLHFVGEIFSQHTQHQMIPGKRMHCGLGPRGHNPFLPGVPLKSLSRDHFPLFADARGSS